MQQNNCDFTMFANLGLAYDFKGLNDDSGETSTYYSVGETSTYYFVDTKIEDDLMSDQLPLLIRTPNGRNCKGQKRDCFILNPRVTESA